MCVRSSTADNDPYNEYIYCYLSSYNTISIIKTGSNLLTNENNPNLQSLICREKDNYQSINNSSKEGYDFLTFDYKVGWPLNIILSRNVMFKYQTLNKYLLKLKISESMLSKCWKSYMSLKNLEAGDLLKPVNILL